MEGSFIPRVLVLVLVRLVLILILVRVGVRGAGSGAGFATARLVLLLGDEGEVLATGIHGVAATRSQHVQHLGSFCGVRRPRAVRVHSERTWVEHERRQRRQLFGSRSAEAARKVVKCGFVVPRGSLGLRQGKQNKDHLVLWATTAHNTAVFFMFIARKTRRRFLRSSMFIAPLCLCMSPNTLIYLKPPPGESVSSYKSYYYSCTVLQALFTFHQPV